MCLEFISSAFKKLCQRYVNIYLHFARESETPSGKFVGYVIPIFLSSAQGPSGLVVTGFEKILPSYTVDPKCWSMVSNSCSLDTMINVGVVIS